MKLNDTTGKKLGSLLPGGSKISTFTPSLAPFTPVKGK